MLCCLWWCTREAEKEGHLHSACVLPIRALPLAPSPALPAASPSQTARTESTARAPASAAWEGGAERTAFSCCGKIHRLWGRQWGNNALSVGSFLAAETGGRAFADLGKTMLCRCGGTPLKAAVRVYTAFTCKYKYLPVCLDEFRSCSLDTLFKVVIFKILRKTPRWFRVLLWCSNSSSSLHGCGKWETSRGVSLRRCSSVNHSTLGSKY